MGNLRYTVPPAYEGETVQNFLRRDCGLSWRMVVKLKQVEQGITADGTALRTIDRLHAGQEVVLRLPDDTVRVEPMDLPLTVAYEDEHLLIVDKPPYLAVHPSAGKTDPTLANIVVAHYEREGQHHAFRPVNRLDRNTSGLLLAAKNAHAAYSLAGKTEKQYLAIVLGRLEGSDVIDAPIRIKEGCCITREVGEGGKESVTHWQALAGDGQVTMVRLWLETGRTHQIRVHMSSIGHPLAGDTMYGTDDTVMPRHALHCAVMSFVHPVTGEPVRADSLLPADMQEVLAAHGLSVPDEDPA